MKIGCTRCGANTVRYVPELEKAHCDHCGSDISVEEFSYNQNEIEYQECVCSSCGAMLIVDDSTVITVCPYCGSNEFLINRFEGDFQPEWIIPFRLDNKQLIEKFMEFKNQFPLLPDDFLSDDKIVNIKGEYVPCIYYEYDCKNYAYGKKPKGEIIELSYADTVPVLQDSSPMLKDEIVNSLIFDVNVAKTFKPIYLNGFSAECYQEKNTEIDEHSFIRFINSVYYALRFSVGVMPYEPFSGTFQIDALTKERRLIYVPVWFIYAKHHGTIYTYAVNGYDGSVIGTMPLDKNKEKQVIMKNSIPVVLISLVILFAILYSGDPIGLIMGIFTLGGINVFSLKGLKTSIEEKYHNKRNYLTNMLYQPSFHRPILPKQDEFIHKYGGRLPKELEMEITLDGEKVSKSTINKWTAIRESFNDIKKPIDITQKMFQATWSDDSMYRY